MALLLDLQGLIKRTEVPEDVERVEIGPLLPPSYQFCAFMLKAHMYQDALHFTRRLCQSDSEMAQLVVQTLDVCDPSNTRMYFLIALVAGSVHMDGFLHTMQAQLVGLRTLARAYGNGAEGYEDGEQGSDLFALVDNVDAYLNGAVFGKFNSCANKLEFHSKVPRYYYDMSDRHLPHFASVHQGFNVADDKEVAVCGDRIENSVVLCECIQLMFFVSCLLEWRGL